MRYSPIACRRAAHSLPGSPPPHIWVSDDLLDSTVNRFFRLSPPHQRRHGSHVPGPLEARRRATKRRLTIQTAYHPQANFWSLFNLQSLFGFRNSTPQMWRYEPPTLPSVSETLEEAHDVSTAPPSPDLVSNRTITPPPNSSIPDISYTTVQDSDVSVDLNIKRVGNEVILPTAIVQPGLDALETAASTACFEDFKSQVAVVADLRGVGRDQVIKKAFRSCSPGGSSSWRYNVMVVKYLVELNYDPMPVFRDIATFEIPPLYTTESRDLLESLQQIHWQFRDSRLYYYQLFTKLAESASHAAVASESIQDVEILLLVRQLWQSARTQGVSIEDSTTQILQTLVSKIQDDKISRSLRSILAKYDEAEHTIIRMIVCASTMENWLPVAKKVLSCIPQERLNVYASAITLRLVHMMQKRQQFSKDTYKLRLSTWLHLLHRLDTTSVHSLSDANLLDIALAQICQRVFAFNTSIQISSDLLLNALLTKLSDQHIYQSAELERLFELTRSVSTPGQNDATPEQVVGSFVRFFSRMKRGALPYEDLLESFLVLTGQHAGLSVVFQLLVALKKQKFTMRDFSIMDKLLVGKVSTIRRPIHQASRKQHQRDALALHTCRKVFEILSHMCPPYTGSPTVTKEALTTIYTERQIGHILDRAKEAHTLPLELRNLSLDMSVQQRVDLIHQLAYYCSRNTTRTHLENWRTLYYLYRHLREHSLPIGPSFTKAVVRVSIIRPLIECRFVSAKRLIWVCNLVARVEGPQVAKGIEHDFWVWRGELFMYAKGVFVRAGGDTKAKAQLGTMKRLKLM